MKWVLNLYPTRWQQRYRHEMEAYLEAEGVNWRTALDLMAGALDAWLHPQWTPVTEQAQEGKTMISSIRCRDADISNADAIQSAGVMIGLTLVLTLISMALDKAVGPHYAIDALLYSTFFIAFTVSSRKTYLKPYSAVASNSMIAIFCIAWYVFFLLVALLASVA